MTEFEGKSTQDNPTEEYRYSYSPIENVKITSISDNVQKLREKIAPFRFKLAAREISKTLQLKAGSRVLELGSGLGLLGKAIKEEVDGNLSYFGIDIAYKSAHAGSKEGLIGVQSDVIKLPFAENSFDAIVTNDVLEHVLDDEDAVNEIKRILKPEGKAFVVIADPSEARFDYIPDHINRDESKSNVEYWEKLFEKKGFQLLVDESRKCRSRDWRKVFNLPYLVKLKDKPGFACAFNPVNRPGTYVLKKQAL